MQSSVVISTVVVLLCLGVVFCAPQQVLYPMTADGFDTVFLDDMSFVNEINVQTWSPTNLTFYVYGQSSVRTVYPSVGPGWTVGFTPNEYWHIPFIDFHTFQNGTDVWGLGPVNAIYARDRNITTVYQGFQFEVAVVTTKVFPNNNNRGRFFLEQPLGFEGTFYSVRLVAFDPNNVIGYFCGFFPNVSNPGQVQFGVLRAHFNISQFADGNIVNPRDGWTFNSSIDVAVLYPFAQLVTYNSDFKPLLLHARNVTSNAPVNTTWLVVVDPYINTVNLITGNYDPTVALNKTSWSWVPTWGGLGVGTITSATIFRDLLFVGVSVAGTGTGWIDVLHLTNLTSRITIPLPTNYSDPRALVSDEDGHIYVGMNGGSAILRIDAITAQITGFQNLPFYLHRTWRGMSTPVHVYFVTNEQHSKVYRVAKADFCPTTCMEFGYCKSGKCVCGQYWDLKDGKCEWHELVTERHTVSVEKDGEIALGVFFALAVVAAAVGWYLVWKNRRGSYQAV